MARCTASAALDVTTRAERSQSMTIDLRSHVETSELTATQIAARTRRIYDTVLQESPSLDGGNFTVIHTSDLARLFTHYDRGFFEAQLRATRRCCAVRKLTRYAPDPLPVNDRSRTTPACHAESAD